MNVASSEEITMASINAPSVEYSTRTAFRALAVNQVLALAIIWLIANAMLRASREVIQDLELDTPIVSNFFIHSLGEVGLFAVAMAAAVAIIGTQWIRNPGLRLTLASIVFLTTIAFLVAAIVSAYLPLERATRLATAIA
jgi:hypothetical protein